MPAQNFARINLDFLQSDFRDRLFEVIAACNARGFVYIATAGFRTYGEQMNTWAQGRTAPGRVVTNAKGGQSAHNFGLAVDFVRDVDATKAGVQPGWTQADFAVLIEECARAGLHSGVGYNDMPHVGHPAYITAGEMKPLDREYGKQVSKGLPTLEVLKQVWKTCIPLLPR